MPLFQYRKRYELHAMRDLVMSACFMKFQYRKRYELHAIWKTAPHRSSSYVFQYRKRYELHAIFKKKLGSVNLSSFNTASGMNCMQSCHRRRSWSRYGFNTASGMNCMQYCFPEPLETANSKAGFLKFLLFLRFSPNPRELFCRKIGSKELLQPVISRKLLSMRKT